MSTEEMLFFSREYNPNPDHWEILGSKDDLTGIATRLSKLFAIVIVII